MGVAILFTKLENWLYLKSEQMEWTSFLHVDTDSQKWNADQKIFRWAWWKAGVASLVKGL